MINKQALGRFQIKSLKVREQETKLRKWQALFYTIRHLQWQAVKGQILRDAIAAGIIEPVAPPVRLKDGSYSRPELDPNDIKQLYSEAWQEFVAAFDAAFVHATLDELVQYAQEHFGMGEKELLALNAQRSAERYNR